MHHLRDLDAFCTSCDEPTLHAVRSQDPGLAVCHPCGDSQVLVVPLSA